MPHNDVRKLRGGITPGRMAVLVCVGVLLCGGTPNAMGADKDSLSRTVQKGHLSNDDQYDQMPDDSRVDQETGTVHRDGFTGDLMVDQGPIGVQTDRSPGKSRLDLKSGDDQKGQLSENLQKGVLSEKLGAGQELANTQEDRLSGILSINHVQADIQKDQPSGNLQVDLFGLTDMRTGPNVQDASKVSPMPSHKSPWLAAGMSLVIPGSGEFYAESYWKAVLFFAVDVTALALAYSFDKKGDQQTDSFQDYANQHWSVVQYAQYSSDPNNHLVPSGKVYNWRIPGTEGMDSFDRPWIQVNWSEVNRMERDIGGYYSHTLPPYNEQQYYELIGKYPQFNQGWHDANLSIGSDYETIKGNLTPMFTYYSGERGKANDYYASATTWVTVAIINHILSAADAAWSAGTYNSAHASVGMRMVPTGTGYQAMAVFEVKVPI